MGDEVEQVIEPTSWVVGNPLMQRGLDLQYPPLSLIQAGSRCAGVHRRLPFLAINQRRRFESNPTPGPHAQHPTRARTEFFRQVRHGLNSKGTAQRPVGGSVSGRGRRPAHRTFDRKTDAKAFLAAIETAVRRGGNGGTLLSPEFALRIGRRSTSSVPFTSG